MTGKILRETIADYRAGRCAVGAVVFAAEKAAAELDMVRDGTFRGRWAITYGEFEDGDSGICGRLKLSYPEGVEKPPTWWAESDEGEGKGATIDEALADMEQAITAAEAATEDYAP
jgi:hypothetical protein